MKAMKVFILNNKGLVISLPFKPTEFYNLQGNEFPADSVILDDSGEYSIPNGMVLTEENAYHASEKQFRIWYALTRKGK